MTYSCVPCPSGVGEPKPDIAGTLVRGVTGVLGKIVGNLVGDKNSDGEAREGAGGEQPPSAAQGEATDARPSGDPSGPSSIESADGNNEGSKDGDVASTSSSIPKGTEGSPSMDTDSPSIVVVNATEVETSVCISCSCEPQNLISRRT